LRDTDRGILSAIESVGALVYTLVGCLVDKPDAISVRAITTGDVTSLQVRVAPEDVGKLVGKQGRMARSLRVILSAASMKLQQPFSLDILEDRSWTDLPVAPHRLIAS
jgi:predicted RNA-binding protein YlqC (UPF0109 family)